MASSLHGALLFTTVLICPGFCLWWPPKANPEREAWIHEERNLSFGEKGERHPNFGEKLSDEQKLKISAANKGEQR